MMIVDGPLFHIVEIDVTTDTPGLTADVLEGWGTQPWGALTRQSGAAASILTLRFSDAGYVDDTGNVYPPLIASAFAIDRRLELEPSVAQGSEAWGSLELSNPDGTLDDPILTRVIDHAPIRIYAGRKRYDLDRACDLDPPRADLTLAFSGLCLSWQPQLRSVLIGLRDITYWLGMPLGLSTFAGSGRETGTEDMAGRTVPMLRGIVTNITPVLVDPVNLVYQISNAPGTITALYEGGYGGGITFSGEVDDVYATPPAAGYYAVQSGSSGLYVRLGSKPVYAITIDAIGQTLSRRAPSSVLDLLRIMLLEDVSLPAGYLDPLWEEATPWAAWPGGWYWDGSTTVTGQDVINTLLAGTGIRLIPTRTGTLRPVLITIPQDIPAYRLDQDLLTSIAAADLGSTLSPPPWRWRVGYQHVFTVQQSGSGLSPQVPADRLTLIAASDRVGVWTSLSLKKSYRVSNDGALMTTALARREDAEDVAGLHGALWGGIRTLWSVTIPRSLGYPLDLGDDVWVQLPVPGASSGTVARVCGEQLRSGDAVHTLLLLVISTPAAARSISVTQTAQSRRFRPVTTIAPPDDGQWRPEGLISP